MKGKQFYLLLSILIASICVSDSCSAFDWHYKWTRTFGSSQDEDIKGIDVDAEGNLYVLGSYTGTFDGNIHRGGGDVYVRKYSTFGTVLWTKTFGGSSYDIAASIKVDSARDNVLIGGAFVGTVNLNPDGNATYQFKEAMYLLNLDKDGGFKWVKVFADVDEGFHGGGGIADIALDDAGNIYYCGLFGSDITTSGKVDFDPSTGTHIIQSTGRTDLFVSKMDAAGNYIWTYSYGEADKWTAGLSLKAYGGAVYVAGGTGGGNGDYWYSGGVQIF